MIYLTGENVFTFNSGTEFSQFERLELFNKCGLETKLLLRDYNRMLAKDIAAHGLDPKAILNMYDYFQEAVLFPRKERPLRLLDSIALQDYHIVGVDNNTSELRYQGNLVGKVDVMPETVGLVGAISYFDRMGHTLLKEYWDWRGFRSLVETYHPDGSIATKEYLKPTGEVALEVAHMYIGNEVAPTSYKLIDYRGKDYVFDTKDQLYTFFLNEVNAQLPGVFISDRRTLDRCVANVAYAQKKLAYIHSVPFVDSKRPQRGILATYQTALTGGNFDQVIFPTKKEATDVKQELALELGTAFAPDSWVKVTDKVKDISAGKTIVYVGRLAEDKNITDLLRSFKEMHLKDQTLRFKLQGYFSSLAYKEQLQKLVTKLNLQDAVEFLDYSPNLDIYEQATLFMNASLNEGFGMNMLEAMSYGVPVVSYANDYSVVKDGENGALVKNKTPKILAKKALSILEAKEMYANLSKGACKTASKYDAKTFITTWKPLVEIS